MREKSFMMKKLLLSFAVMFLMVFAIGVNAKAAPVAPGQVTGVKQTDYGTNSLDVEWMAQLTSGVRYEVEVSLDKVNWVQKSDTTSNSSYIYQGINAGSTYYVRVRAYVKEWNSTLGKYEYAYGAYSAVTECVTSPNSRPSSFQMTDSTVNSLKVEWSSVPGANAYYVYYRNDASSNNVKTTLVRSTAAKVSTTLKNLSKNSSYTVWVCPARISTTNFVAVYDSYSYNYNLGVTPSKVTGVDVTHYWSAISEISVECNKIASASGYQAEVWTAYKKKDTKVASASGSYSVYLKKSALKKHNFFKVRMRAYSVTSTGKKKYGAWSSWKYTCQQPDVTKMKSTSKGMNIKFDKISGADRYEIYMSIKQKSGYKKVATTKKTSYTVTKWNKKKLKKGKKYYVYVVAYNKVGKKYYSGEAGDATYCWYKKY